MLGWSVSRRVVPFALCFSTALVACSDTNDPSPEPAVTTLQLTVATDPSVVVTVSGSTDCTVTGGPITIPLNTATTITASFLNASGVADEVASDATRFSLAGTSGADPSPTPSSITFTRTTAVSGTILGSEATTEGSMTLSLYDNLGHDDWGPCAVPITVNP